MLIEMETFMEVPVFKTNIGSPDAKPLIARSLAPLAGVLRWSVDLGDRDRVLRVEAESVGPAEIIQSLASAGFCCEVLA